jgi:UDP-N-acetylglucosamine acyltransferase
MSSEIDKTAIISKDVQLGENIKVGPYVIIGKGVEVGDNCEIMHHVVIETNTHIKANCKFYPFCAIGTDPQDITYKGEETFLTIGRNNTFREFVQINRGTSKADQKTVIGDNNFIMAYSHIGHDCTIGNNVLLTNGATLAGHVIIDDYAVIGAFSSVHQFVRVGRNAYIGGYTIVLQDILPFAKISQTRDFYDLYGPNAIGMRRCGMSSEKVNEIKEIYRIIYRENLNTKVASDRIRLEFPKSNEAREILDFIDTTKRGLLKNFSFKNKSK